MSNNLDFFGGQAGNPGQHAAEAGRQVAVPAAQLDQRFGLPGTSWQPAVSLTSAPSARSRVSARTLILLLVVVIAALAGGGYYLVSRPHPVALPSALGGLQRLDLHGGTEAAQVKSAKSRLGSLGLHDIALGLYANSSAPQQDLFVVAGRGSASTNFTQEMSALSGESVVPGVTVSPVNAGGLTLQCVTVTQTGGSGAFCVWQGPSAVLFAFGSALTAQEVGDALAEVRTADALN